MIEQFFKYDELLEFSFAVITLIVAFFAYKIYKLSGERQTKYLSAGFILISLSYFIQSFLNSLITFSANDLIMSDFDDLSEIVFQLKTIHLMNSIAIYAYMLLFAAGLMTLAYMTFNIKSEKAYSLFLVLIASAIIFGNNPIYLFYFLSCVLFAYLVHYFTASYIKHKQKNQIIILTAFIFLLLGSIHFLFSVKHDLYYVIGHILELFAYLLILVSLITTLRKL